MKEKNEEKLLTVLIPFLNEKEEVEHTVQSVLEHSNDEVEILLINDASDDGYAYEELARKYAVEYIRNDERIGVAASRDKGVACIRTPYFLFLDAHMRFYDNRWVDRIVQELQADPKALLCCQTLGLHLIDGQVLRNRERPPSFGATIDFYNPHAYFESHWLFKEKEGTATADTLPIPCVLGAAYACTKSYWLYLKGLSGLMFYGNDESYISMKVWLEGGRCKLLKDVAAGHIYRDAPPYPIENAPRLYNRLFLAELFLPDQEKARMFSHVRRLYPTIFPRSVAILYQRRVEIEALKRYYRGLFKHTFEYYENLNKAYATFEPIVEDKASLVRDIADYLVVNNQLAEGVGLINGKLGIVLFLFEYARQAAPPEHPVYLRLAELLLDGVWNALFSTSFPESFNDGIFGIGWGIEYLYQNGFVDCDTNEILEDIDRKAIAFLLDSIEDFHTNEGIGGLVLYLMARLYTIEKERKNNPFPLSFLSAVYEKIQTVWEKKKETDCPELLLRYSLYFEKVSSLPQPSIYDIAYLTLPEDYEIEKYRVGIDGSAGVGFKLLFEDYK